MTKNNNTRHITAPRIIPPKNERPSNFRPLLSDPGLAVVRIGFGVMDGDRMTWLVLGFVGGVVEEAIDSFPSDVAFVLLTVKTKAAVNMVYYRHCIL